MPNAFATISFTPSVKAAQEKYGSRAANMGFELADDARDEITEVAAQFIAERDSFYQATVSESGWPYVQHRGGPTGFLKVLDAKTIGFADFRGNIQYLSVGNLNANNRISIILMDYANRRRLKIWGTVRIVHEDENPELIARLEVPSYRARVERGIVIDVEAIDWNCPQHITPRFSEAEFDRVLAPILEENELLKSQIIASQSNLGIAQKTSELGDGDLPLIISGIRQLTPRVRAFELRHPNGEALPEVEAGSHLSVPIMLKDGSITTRHYSICSNPARRDVYEIAVLLEADGTGGSQAAHDLFEVGLKLHCGLPQNNFRLHNDSRPAVLIAGGIGITPIKAMAQSLKAQGRKFQLHYAGKNVGDMAYSDRLNREFGNALTLYPTDQNQRLDIKDLMVSSPKDAVFYVCGPARLIDGVVAEGQSQGINSNRIRFERFSITAQASDKPIEVELRRSNKLIHVAANQTVLDAVEAAGIATPSGCRAGNCGTCAVKVLEGAADHRDSALSEAERSRAGLMCICISRAKSERLILDI